MSIAPPLRCSKAEKDILRHPGEIVTGLKFALTIHFSLGIG